MELVLQNLRTGVRFATDAGRLLVGTAEHADVPLPAGGPYLAALLHFYPTGWVLHALSEEPQAVVSGTRRLPPAGRVYLHARDEFAVGPDRYRVEGLTAGPGPADTPDPPFFLTLAGADGHAEYRRVDHDTLIGRLMVNHIQHNSRQLSRVHALLACEGGEWYVHNLAATRIGRNRVGVTRSATLANADVLQIGPLKLTLDLGDAAPPVAPPPAAPPPADGCVDLAVAPPPLDQPTAPGYDPDLAPDPPAAAADTDESPANTDQDPAARPGTATHALHQAGLHLDRRLRRAGQDPARRSPLRAVQDRLAVAAALQHVRRLRDAGDWLEAHRELDLALTDRPDARELLLELYRLYAAAGLTDLCYRPLREVERLDDLRLKPDPAVLADLARVCEALAVTKRELYKKACEYWTRVEQVTGVSYARERNEVMARRAMADQAFPPG